MLILSLVALFLRPSSTAAAEEPRQLQLEVSINDTPIHLIGAFTQLADRRIAARRTELTEMGIKAPGSGSGDDLIVLDDMTDVEYRYDEPTQAIFFKLGDDRRVAKTFDARGSSEEIAASRTDYGGVLNYALFGSSTKSVGASAFTFSGANASLDGRIFGPSGTLSQSAIIGATTTRNFDALRLDTTWSYSDPKSLLTYRAGDIISGGLAWTRPIRAGGVQMQNNFALRPDLVTLPLPTVSGSAAVPSTLDVYVDSVKTHSQEVPAGPYQISNVPMLSGAGTARVVVRDAAGRQTEMSLPFYTSPKLLKPDLVDFSVEAGAPRILYGSQSSNYVASPIGAASLRGGLYDWLTAEAHVEGGTDFFNGGVGAVTSLNSAGLLSLAGSGSGFRNSFGFQSYVAYDAQFGAVNFHASSHRTFKDYNDLASVTARFLPTPLSTIASPSLLLTSAKPARSAETISIGFPIPFEASLNFGFLHQMLDDGTRSNIFNVSYSKQIFSTASLSVTAFADLSDKKNVGIFFGLSMPLGLPASLGGPVYASASASSTRNGTNTAFDVVKSMQAEPGSYGWGLRENRGSSPSRSAAGSYRSSVAQFDGFVQQAAATTNASGQIQGAIAVAGGGVFASNRIDDAFAVVNVGAPDVEVQYENRPAGRTDARGQLLVPGLRSYQKNQIAIEPRDLPLDADAAVTQNIVAPADRSGVVVNFGVKTEVRAAVVVFAGKDGNFIAAGSRGQLEGGSEAFVVGYDGRAYVKELGDANTVTVADGTNECRASFPFAPAKNNQVVIGPVVCQ
ncbi:MAG: outer rane usher protein [Alphaproteobacteria bacterium]|nr:outer rane usher protein [Alphaproteobacteria bacterium]